MLGSADLDRVRAHPGFPAYMRRATQIWRAPLSVDAILASNLRDLGRFVAGLWSLYLYATPGGFTLARLSSLLEQTGISGPGRARSMIIFLRFIGYIEPVKGSGDARKRAFQPTERMAAAFRERYRLECEAAAPLDPAFATGLARINEPDFFMAMMAAIGELTLAGLQQFEPQQTSLNAVSHRFAGMMLVGELLATAETPDSAYPPVGTFRFSLATLAKTCGISRTQARRILRAGTEEGFFVMPGEGEVELTDLLAEHVALLIACTFLMVQWGCLQAIAASGIQAAAE